MRPRTSEVSQDRAQDYRQPANLRPQRRKGRFDVSINSLSEAGSGHATSVSRVCRVSITLYQGMTSVVPQKCPHLPGFSPWTPADASDSKHPFIQTPNRKLSRIRHSHHSHNPGLHGIGHHKIGRIGNAPRHIETDHKQSGRANFANSSLNFTTHERSREHQRTNSRESWHSANGVSQLLLAHQRNRIHRDMLAANIMPVGLHDSADGHLADLRPAAHNNDALPINLFHTLDELNIAHHRVFAQRPEHFVDTRGSDFKEHPRAFGGVLNNRDRSDIAVVLGNHAADLMQYAEAGDSVHQESMPIGIHWSYHLRCEQ